ncbi:hypothetical protein RUM44_006385 [Polyplax serrata]|uniref:SAM domain-containing protein n=1 Tax=Polyplax serrata TaxID=468196 RepID=A0ABR1AHZ3_POLSC
MFIPIEMIVNKSHEKLTQIITPHLNCQLIREEFPWKITKDKLARGNVNRTEAVSQILINNRNGESNLVGHSHLRPQVHSPGKTDSGIIIEAGTDKCRSPVPLSPDGTISAQVVKLSPEFNCQQTSQWLRKNSFGNYVSTFSNFTGADILRLTRDDLIQICGLPDGIRLLYALHSKAIVRLTLYMCTPSSPVYHAVYLDQIGRTEMNRKLSGLLGIHHTQIQDVFLQGPNEIRVLLTDEVVGNIKDESMFIIEVLKDETRDQFALLLKPTGPTSS